MTEVTAIDQEVDRNFEVFEEILESLIAKHEGKFALMRDCRIVEFYTSAANAVRGGKAKFGDSIFSVQEVSESVLDLGYFSHVGNNRLL